MPEARQISSRTCQKVSVDRRVGSHIGLEKNFGEDSVIRVRKGDWSVISGLVTIPVFVDHGADGQVVHIFKSTLGGRRISVCVKLEVTFLLPKLCNMSQST